MKQRVVLVPVLVEGTEKFVEGVGHWEPAVVGVRLRGADKCAGEGEGQATDGTIPRRALSSRLVGVAGLATRRAAPHIRNISFPGARDGCGVAVGRSPARPFSL